MFEFEQKLRKDIFFIFVIFQHPQFNDTFIGATVFEQIL
jgi:hypothetical protein